MTIGAPQPVLRLAARLGEGPTWFDGVLWFVDILGRNVHRFDPETGAERRWPMPSQVGWVLPVEGGGAMVGLQTGLYRFDAATGKVTQHAAVEPQLPGNRLNDACVDPAGRLWFGTMDDAHKAPSGRFYQMIEGRVLPIGVAPCAITNGPAVSPDGRTLYTVDTLAQLITAHDIAQDGTLSRPRPFVRITAGEGFPDGPSVDARGNVWIGLYGGFEARRYAPDGTLSARVRFPVSNITKVTFGGADMRTAYATTATNGLNATTLAKQPNAGDVFAFEVDIPGLATPAIKL